jgi:hypothetical protein
MLGLYNKPGRGNKKTFDWQQEETIREWGKQEPRQLKKVLQKLKEEWDILTSTDTIKRIRTKVFYELASYATRCRRRARPDRI